MGRHRMAQHRTSHLALILPVIVSAAALAASVTFGASVALAGSAASPYLTRFHNRSVVASTVPAHGDLNP